MQDRFCRLKKVSRFFAGKPFFVCAPECLQRRRAECGSILFYIFIAVGLLAALTYTFTQSSRDNTTVQSGYRSAEELYVQINTIRSAISECTVEYPAGGGDIDSDGDIDATDNPNNPYPVVPTHADNPHGVAADDTVRNVTCTGAPTADANIFQGAGNKGRLLPPPPGGFDEWVYVNDTDGVRLEITGENSAATKAALSRLMNKFATCQADLDYNSCGANCFTVWVKRNTCP